MAAKNTKKIKLTQSIGGHRTRINEKKQVEVIGQFSYDKDRVLDWDAEEADRMIDRGIAEAVA